MSHWAAPSAFQSPPVLSAGCDFLVLHAENPGALRVSIPTRPFGRVRLAPRLMELHRVLFQSPPVLSAGCDRLLALRAGRRASFNPHPSFRPGATSSAVPTYG